MLLLPALNPMFDIVTTRTEAMNIHPPLIIFAMLGVLALAAALLAGYAMAGSKTSSWVPKIVRRRDLLTVSVIVDIEHPRFGLISVESAHRVPWTCGKA